jgi:hypothetical protein
VILKATSLVLWTFNVLIELLLNITLFFLLILNVHVELLVCRITCKRLMYISEYQLNNIPFFMHNRKLEILKIMTNSHLAYKYKDNCKFSRFHTSHAFPESSWKFLL